MLATNTQSSTNTGYLTNPLSSSVRPTLATDILQTKNIFHGISCFLKTRCVVVRKAIIEVNYKCWLMYLKGVILYVFFYDSLFP